jgi:transposase
MRTTENITLSSDEYQTLKTWAQARSIPARLVQRASIIAMAAGGISNKDIAKKLNISRPTVQLWRSRFLSLRLAGLKKDAPRPGRIPKISNTKIKAVIEATINTTPPNATHWSTRTMAKAQGLSEATVRRIWKKHNLKPHLIKTFKLSNDKHFVDKLYDIVGLYLNPPDRSLVLCVDEKSQIQALERTQPSLPIKKGRCGTMTHDYKRNGTTTLFAALSMLDGKVIGDCMPRHRHHEFIRFLKKIDKETTFGFDLHLIVDNYSTHKHPQVRSWIDSHPRFHLHFTPTSSSWLNLVERFFAEITNKRIRRGSFKNVSVLIKAIKEYLNSHNQNPQVFVWSAPVERILEKISKCKEALDAVH